MWTSLSYTAMRIRPSLITLSHFKDVNDGIATEFLFLFLQAYSSAKECGLLEALPKDFTKQLSSGPPALRRNLSSWRVRTAGDVLSVKAPLRQGGISAQVALSSSLKLLQEGQLPSKPLLLGKLNEPPN